MRIEKRGAIILNEDICCDGYSYSNGYRVQTHVHEDHLSNFERSTQRQNIILTPQSLELIAVIKNIPSIRHRPNVIPLEYNKQFNTEKYDITLFDAGHMLGSSQVEINDKINNKKIGYSGDFSHGLDYIIQVDELFVDATYGDPDSVRKFTQAEVEKDILELIADNINSNSIIINGKRGTIVRAMIFCNKEFEKTPLLVSTKLEKEINIYKEQGFGLNNYYTPKHDDYYNILDTNKYIRFYGSGDSNHGGIRNNQIAITLKSIFGRHNSIIEKDSEKAFVAALSDHADFNETMEYIKKTGAKKVYTDTKIGWERAAKLAHEIRTKLDIVSEPAPIFEHKE